MAGATFRQIIVFVIGGGTNAEASNLHEWAAAATPPREVVYGATSLLVGDAFLRELCDLGARK